MKTICECEHGNLCKWPPFHGWKSSGKQFHQSFLLAHKKYCNGEIIVYEIIDTGKRITPGEVKEV